MLAKLAVTACARLGGYLTGDLASPENKEVKRSLCSLITPYISQKLKENNPHEVAKHCLLYPSFFSRDPKFCEFSGSLIAAWITGLVLCAVVPNMRIYLFDKPWLYLC